MEFAGGQGLDQPISGRPGCQATDITQHGSTDFDILQAKLEAITELIKSQSRPDHTSQTPHNRVPAISEFRLKVEAALDRLLVPALSAEFLSVFMCTAVAIASGIAYPDDTGIRAAMIVIAVGLMLQFSIPISGGHINPAYTMAFWITKGFPGKKVPLYALSQFLGGFLAGFFIVISRWDELQAGKSRMMDGRLDMCSIGGPVPMLVSMPGSSIPHWKLWLHGAFSMSIQSFGIWFSGEKIRKNVPSFLVGWTVALGVGLSLFMGKGFPVTLNPAADLGPRCVAAMVFGKCALKDPYALIALLGSTSTAVLNFIILEYIFANSKRRIELGHAIATDEEPRIVRVYSSMKRTAFLSFRPPIETDAQAVPVPDNEAEVKTWDVWKEIRQRRRLADVEMGEPQHQATEIESYTA